MCYIEVCLGRDTERKRKKKKRRKEKKNNRKMCMVCVRVCERERAVVYNADTL